MLTKVCPICGTEFKTDNYRAKYCSDECKKQGRRLTSAKWRESHPDYIKDWMDKHPDYQKEWYDKHPHYGRNRSRERRGTVEYHRECEICGKPFVTTFPWQLTCSEDCHNIFNNTREPRRLRRLKENGPIDPTVTLKSLIERDEGICYLCGEPIDESDYTIKNGVKCLGLNYPSIDHVIPVVKGGTHTWDNVRLAHMGCNAKKGAKYNG